MKYRLVYTKPAIKDIKKLDSIAKKRLGRKLLEYSSNPLSFAKKLTNSVIGTYRWRIGTYRVVFDFEGKDIVILRVQHRKEVYRR